MTKVFSIIHATRGRPKKAAEAMARWCERASRPNEIEYIMCCDENDETRFEVIRLTNRIDVGFYSYVDHPGQGSASAWDFGAKFSTGTILIQGQDDVEPPVGWDDLLVKKIVSAPGPNPWEEPAFIAVSDGFRKDELCCTAIMNRARYKQQKEFIHPGYLSVFSDDDVTYRAKRDARDGKCIFINARDLVFLHRHHYHDKSVPMDATYELENSAEAYRIGGALFAKRNPDAFKDGLRNW